MSSDTLLSEEAREAKREYFRSYREANKEKIKDYQQNYKRQNKETIKKNEKDYWERQAAKQVNQG